MSCIKANELDLALDVYRQLLSDSCTPNLVTYNTLIDVYGKTGQWEEAVKVLDALEHQVRCTHLHLQCTFMLLLDTSIVLPSILLCALATLSSPCLYIHIQPSPSVAFAATYPG